MKKVLVLVIVILLIACTSDPALKMLDLINTTREGKGLEKLTYDPAMSEVAKAHAQDMIDNNFFSHKSPTTGTLAARLRNADIKFKKVAENLAGCNNVKLAHELLLKSSAHGANIVSDKFTHVGIAVVKGGAYGSMIVVLFCDFE